ncbi:unnamed protein product [Arabidopsis lyrata]|uniref:DUF7356 domain-containing protein n=3 Tax=Arabidopsis lyrata TaxID=59689 RepID=D7LTW3_ARALL|nr:uncharacterized protein LOC9312163 [Arabidopsis lyrata subsp. lyrata]EFH54070.1 hypothetical protein ARALYDRAFT_485510 [Arabidopsis lyrata subsp. lyrata]CAH8268269.1 unnamed protein product [Arabidopsis lyrata]|eukprot:XP_020880406.1 uncharacterized protein LOC9312163 [Arabidopsis lyrata subsp. lyrata]
MDTSQVLSLLLLILFISNASSFDISRELVDEETHKDNSNSTTKQESPLLNPKPSGDGKSNVTSSEPTLPTSNSTNPNPKEPDSVSPPPPLLPGIERNDTKVLNTTELISPPPPPANLTDSQDSGKLPAKMAPPPKSLESGKNGTEPGKESPPLAKDPDKAKDDKGSSESASVETCIGKSNICRTENSLVACTLSIDKGSANWLILVQNDGEKSLKAKIVLPVNSLQELTLPKHHSQRINISISGDTNKIILDGGKGECALHMYPSEENTLPFHFPSYEKLVTPINGAYFLIVSVVIFGGIWAFCLCRKNRRAGTGVPYRELELSGGPGLENESVVHDVETADWDEGWDDDWDENNAVKSPGGAAKSVSISANGLTARAPNRDGWDHDWDD